jgi:hypothetical protein
VALSSELRGKSYAFGIGDDDAVRCSRKMCCRDPVAARKFDPRARRLTL